MRTVLVSICIWLPVCLFLVLGQSALGQTQLQMNEQSNLDFQKAEQDLNSVYEKLSGKVSADGQKSLRAAEDSWIHFRDLECSFESLGSVGGSVHSMAVRKCKLERTKQRIKELDRQLNCQEGDITCGNQ